MFLHFINKNMKHSINIGILQKGCETLEIKYKGLQEIYMNYNAALDTLSNIGESITPEVREMGIPFVLQSFLEELTAKKEDLSKIGEDRLIDMTSQIIEHRNKGLISDEIVIEKLKAIIDIVVNKKNTFQKEVDSKIKLDTVFGILAVSKDKDSIPQPERVVAILSTFPSLFEKTNKIDMLLKNIEYMISSQNQSPEMMESIRMSIEAMRNELMQVTKPLTNFYSDQANFGLTPDQYDSISVDQSGNIVKKDGNNDILEYISPTGITTSAKRMVHDIDYSGPSQGMRR